MLTEDTNITKSGPYPPPALVHKLMTKTPQNTFCSKSATENIHVPASVTMKWTLRFHGLYGWMPFQMEVGQDGVHQLDSL